MPRSVSFLIEVPAVRAGHPPAWYLARRGGLIGSALGGRRFPSFALAAAAIPEWHRAVPAEDLAALTDSGSLDAGMSVARTARVVVLQIREVPEVSAVDPSTGAPTGPGTVVAEFGTSTPRGEVSASEPRA